MCSNWSLIQETERFKNLRAVKHLKLNIFVFWEEGSHDSGVVLGKVVDISNVGNTRL